MNRPSAVNRQRWRWFTHLSANCGPTIEFVNEVSQKLLPMMLPKASTAELVVDLEEPGTEAEHQVVVLILRLIVVVREHVRPHQLHAVGFRRVVDRHAVEEDVEPVQVVEIMNHEVDKPVAVQVNEGAAG